MRSRHWLIGSKALGAWRIRRVQRDRCGAGWRGSPSASTGVPVAQSASSRPIAVVMAMPRPLQAMPAIRPGAEVDQAGQEIWA